ncbi:MAG: hypothetical protein MI799_06490 [Desulfobacterales bacterium]|nr:hypothetical protein [Desulfobacterales bacterium]
MIAENDIIPGAEKIVENTGRGAGFGVGYQTKKSNRKKDRRKARYDRRKSVRDGVIVTLSFKKDRRKTPDRRLQASARPAPAGDAKSSGYGIIA